MKRIFKYMLMHGIDMTVHMRLSSKPVHVDIQNHAVTLWMEEQISGDDYVNRTFKIVGTGWDVGENCEYVGTAIDREPNLVWHVYEVK